MIDYSLFTLIYLEPFGKTEWRNIIHDNMLEKLMDQKKSLKLSEISRLVNGQLIGDGEAQIWGVARLDEARDGDLSFITSPKYLKQVSQTGASALLVYPDFPEEIKINAIKVAAPYVAALQAAHQFLPQRKPVGPGIHETAIVGEGTRIDESASIGPYVVIGRDCIISAKVCIGAGTVISDGVSLGSETIIYQNVSIRDDCIIGKRVTIHPGAVIGADGFGFNNVNGVYEKIPQLGIVVIEDDVEIGANTCIDRATVGATRIKRGTKLDNLIQIAHNVVVGENTVIAGQVGVSGSCAIGNGVIIAGQVGLRDHVSIGDGAILLAQCGITKNVPPNTMMSGYPARAHLRAKREEAVIRELPELKKVINDLRKRINEIEQMDAADSGKDSEA